MDATESLAWMIGERGWPPEAFSKVFAARQAQHPAPTNFQTPNL